MTQQSTLCVVCLQPLCVDPEHAIATHKTDQLTQAINDNLRFRWLANLACHELSIGLNRDNACNYRSVRQWIEEHPEDFDEVAPDELKRMRETDKIWSVQLYPTGSVSFYITMAATLEKALDEMIETISAEYPKGIPPRPVE